MNPCCLAIYYTNNKKIKNPFCPMCGNPIFIQKAIAEGKQIDFQYLVTDVRTGDHLPNCIILHPELDAGAIVALNAYNETLNQKTQQGANLRPLTLDELKNLDGKEIWVEQVGIERAYDWKGYGTLNLENRRITTPRKMRRCCHTDLMDSLDKGMYKEIRAYENKPEEEAE